MNDADNQIDSRPEALFQYERGYEGECCLQCPVCGFEYTHPIGAWTRVGSDDGEAGVYHGTQAVGVTDERRSALVTAFWCEEGHRFALVFQQHKGINLVTVERLADMPADLSECDKSFRQWLDDQQIRAQARLREIKEARQLRRSGTSDQRE